MKAFNKQDKSYGIPYKEVPGWTNCGVVDS
jgi:hypothetical protein